MLQERNEQLNRGYDREVNLLRFGSACLLAVQNNYVTAFSEQGLGLELKILEPEKWKDPRIATREVLGSRLGIYLNPFRLVLAEVAAGMASAGSGLTSTGWGMTSTSTASWS